MKKILSLLGTITLIGTSTTSLVACNKPQEYTKEELTKLKEKNKINTKDGILEWIAAQEIPFNQVDNKYYFVIWRNDNSGDWKISKFKNNIKLNVGETYTINESLYLFNGNFAADLKIDLQVILKNGVPLGWFFDRDSAFLKSVYRWNKDNEPNVDVENKLKSYLDL
ncbi:lipoprotein [Spiroplasma endosymbiont of Phyllotreta cruciferae]|uniref:lipoprotein n=1 Tax=Spiroplasma endosymbiont of Phyllotreta cruciferae TaxID=2886375 RepID=UPI0020A22136|nr:lipoprotein [Spiroplasma endosymbiont of Phyllotreta cruciferae]